MNFKKIAGALIITALLVTIPGTTAFAHGGGHHGGRNNKSADKVVCTYEEGTCPYGGESCAYADGECPYGGGVCPDGAACADTTHHHYQHNAEHNGQCHGGSGRGRGGSHCRAIA